MNVGRSRKTARTPSVARADTSAPARTASSPEQALPSRAVRPPAYDRPVFDADTAALDPIRSLGAQLWVLEVAPARHHVDGWLPDWRYEREDPSTSVGFGFELEGDTVSAFELLVQGRRLSFPDVTTIGAAVRKLRVAVKVIQGRIIVADAGHSSPPP